MSNFDEDANAAVLKLQKQLTAAVNRAMEAESLLKEMGVRLTESAERNLKLRAALNRANPDVGF